MRVRTLEEIRAERRPLGEVWLSPVFRLVSGDTPFGSVKHNVVFNT